MAYKINGTTVVDNSRNVCACCVTSCCITASSRMDAPSGNTASRPSSPATGSLYFDTDLGSLVSYNGTEWASVGGGGLETDEFSNDYYSAMYMTVRSNFCLEDDCACCPYSQSGGASLEAPPGMRLPRYNGEYTIYRCTLNSQCGAWKPDVPGKSKFSTGEVIVCMCCGQGQGCAYSWAKPWGCRCRAVPCLLGYEKNSMFPCQHACGAFQPSMDGGVFTKHFTYNPEVACCTQRQDWSDSFITKKGGVYTRSGQVSTPCCCIVGRNGVDIGPYYAPAYYDVTSCLGPIISMPVSVAGSSSSGHVYLAPPLMYIACTNSALGGPEEEICDYAFLPSGGKPIDPFPFHWENSCLKICYACPDTITTGFGGVCYSPGGVNGCLMPWFTMRTDLTSPPSLWNKEMYTAPCSISCDGICVKAFDPSCCPAMWFSFFPATCNAVAYQCVPAGQASASPGPKHWDCNGDVMWSFDWVCFPNLCALSPACSFQCNPCQCKFDLNCTLLITKFCRPHASFQYWSPIQPKCFMPYECCKGCTYLTNCHNITSAIFCQMGFSSQGSIGGFRNPGRCALSNTSKVSENLCYGGTLMSVVNHGDIIQHPSCSNRLLIFGNGNYDSHTTACTQSIRHAPTYTVFNKSTCQIECSINFYSMLETSYSQYNAQIAKWYTSSPKHLCNCTVCPCDALGCLWLGTNVSCPKCTVAACIQAITGSADRSLLAHCQGHDFDVQWNKFRQSCGTDLNLVGTGNFCSPSWYYNCCTDHLVFIGGIINCSSCLQHHFGCSYYWLGAVCFDLTNCCVSKVNQLWPSTDPNVNCKFVDPNVCTCLRMCAVFNCVLGVKSACGGCSTIGLDFSIYASDKSSEVGGVNFIAEGIRCYSFGGLVPSGSCCAVYGQSLFFGCTCTGACPNMTGGCNGCYMELVPEAGRAKAPFNVPLECIGWKSSEIMKNFFNIRWLGALAYHPFSSSAACKMQYNACALCNSNEGYMFFPGFCRLCYGGCFCPSPTGGTPTMQCCCMFCLTRTYMQNQTIRCCHCILICGGFYSGSCDIKLCCHFTNSPIDCEWKLTCKNTYCQAIRCNSSTLFTCLAPCHFATDATKRYSCYLRINNNIYSPKYQESGSFNAKAPHKMQDGEDLMDGAVRLYNEGIICIC